MYNMKPSSRTSYSTQCALHIKKPVMTLLGDWPTLSGTTWRRWRARNRMLWLAVLTTALTACSLNWKAPLVATAQPPVKTRPPVPDSLHFQRPQWALEGERMCLAVAGFKKEARNWGQVLRYVKQTQGFISYYEGGK